MPNVVFSLNIYLPPTLEKNVSRNKLIPELPDLHLGKLTICYLECLPIKKRSFLLKIFTLFHLI